MWLVLLVAVAAVIGRDYLLRAWGQRDQFLKQQVVRKLEELFPQATIELDEVRYDFGHEVGLTGFTLRPQQHDLPIVNLPKVMVHINRDALIERQQLEVLKVVVQSPQLNVIRNHDGSWNWQALRPLSKQGGSSLPEVEIEDGTVRVVVEQAPGVPSGTLAFEHVDVQLVPSGKRQFRVRASSRCEHTGQIELLGRWHLDQNTGQFDGQFTEITVGQELLGLAASFAPSVKDRLHDWETKVWELLHSTTNSSAGNGAIATTGGQTSFAPNAGAGLPQLAPAIQTPMGAADSIFGLRATCNLAFRISRPEPDIAPTFRVRMNIAHGEITNPILPFPLKELRGELSADNESFRIKSLTAHNGGTKLLIDGELKGRDAGFPGKFKIELRNLICDERVRSRMSAGFRRLVEQHHPSGDVDLDCFLVHDQDGRWRPEDLLVTANDCSIIHEAFAYPVHNVNGTIQQNDRELLIEMRGMAGDREVTLEGTITDPGPDATVVLDIRASEIPLDETFVKACRPEIQTVLRQLQLTGIMDGQVRLTKAPRQPMVPRIEAVLRGGSLNYSVFPYRVVGVSGRLTALGSFWQFKDITGKHGPAQLSAEGTFAKLPQKSELNLRVVAKSTPIDASLLQALPASLRRTLNEFSPTGTLNLTTEVHWATGQPVNVQLPEVSLTDGSVRLRSLPYQLQNVQGQFTYLPGENGLPRLTIQSFSGRHGDLITAVKGYQKFEPNGDWRAHFDEFSVENLTPNTELLDSLAQLPGLQQVFASLNANQSLRLNGIMDLRGTPDPQGPVTAAWDLDAYFSGGTIHTGLDFKDLRGKVSLRGNWDGENAHIPEGWVDLSSARILDYTLNDVRGPFRVERGKLIFGAGDTRVRALGAIDPREQLRARVFDGTITLDGEATLAAVPEYRVLMNLTDCQLSRFAALHAPKQRDLQGIANGWINLDGRGSSPADVQGRGKIQISPAKLLTVPVVLQLYRSLSLSPPAESTFNYALFDFDIRKAAFAFRQIFLESENISFRGKGTVTFTGDAKLEFISLMPRNQIPIPILHEIVGEATKGWVGIEVSGPLAQPRTRVKAAPLLDDTLKEFLGRLPQPFFPLGQGLRPRGIDRQ